MTLVIISQSRGACEQSTSALPVCSGLTSEAAPEESCKRRHLSLVFHVLTPVYLPTTMPKGINRHQKAVVSIASHLQPLTVLLS
jgi:hypothetical protein